MSSELAVIAPKSIEEAERLSKTLAVSQLLPDALRQRPQDVLAVVLTGAELGLAPMQAIRGIRIIKGQPTLSAEAMGALVRRRSDVCEYLVLRHSDATRATYETKRRGDPTPTTMTFTMEDAQRAGLTASDNWRKYPAAMLRARCLSAICKAVYSDLVLGLYDPEELESVGAAQPAQPAEKDITPTQAVPRTASEARAQLRAKMAERAAKTEAAVEDAQVVDADRARAVSPRECWERAVALGADAGMDPRAVGAELRRLTGKAGWRELTPEDVDAFRRWLEDEPQSESEPAQPSPSSIEETTP